MRRLRPNRGEMTHSRLQSQEKAELELIARPLLLCFAVQHIGLGISLCGSHALSFTPKHGGEALPSGAPESALLAQAQFGHIFPQCLARSCHIGSLIRLGVFTIRWGKQLWHKTKAFVSQRSYFLDIGQLAPGPWEQRHLPTSKEDTSPLPGTRWVVFGECVASCSKPTVVPVSYISYLVLDSLLQQTEYSLQVILQPSSCGKPAA